MGNCIHRDGGAPCGKPTVGAGKLCAAHIVSGKSESVVTSEPSKEGGVAWEIDIKRYYKIDKSSGGSGGGGGDGIL